MRKFQSLSRRKRYIFLGLMALLILLLIGGFFGLEQTVFARSHSLAVASPTTQVSMTVPSATATPLVTVTPSLTPRSQPTATPSSTLRPQPTAMPSSTSRSQPTVAPSPAATPSPAILTVTPNTFYFRNCTLEGRSSWLCTFTLSNSSSTSTLVWTAKAWNSLGDNKTSFLSSTSGNLIQSGTTTVSLFITGEAAVCTPTAYLQFTGPENSVTVTVTC